MIDGRLLVPAGAAWAGAAVTLAWSPAVGALLCVGTAAIGLSFRRRWGIVPVLLGTVFAGLGLMAALSLGQRLSPEPLESWTQQRVTATVHAVISGEPRLHVAGGSGQWWAQPWMSLPVRTQDITARGVTMTVGLPLRLHLPPDAVPPPRGTAVLVTGRLAPLPAETGLASELRVRGLDWTVVGPPGPIEHIASAMRLGLTDSLSGAPADAGSLVRGLTIGDVEGQPPDLARSMRASGLSHLVAVSGGNVAIVVGVVVGAVAVLRLSLLWRVGSGLLALAYYAYLVGPEPSVLRASVMGAIALIGVLVGGRRAGPSVLGTGVLLLIVTMPWLALSWGFALSAMATAGLILLAPLVRDRLEEWRPTRRWPPVVLAATSLTLAAQLATLPLLLAMGGAVGWVSVPANVVAMPMVAPVTVLGLAAATVSPLLPEVADRLAAAAVWPAQGIAWVAHTAPQLPLAQWPVGTAWPTGIPGVLVLGCVLVVLALIWRIRRSVRWRGIPTRWRALLLSALALMVVVVSVRPPAMRGWPPPNWIVLMCDVGQGDGLLLRVDDDSAIVVDAGGDPDLIDACLLDARIADVPAIVLTHFHADHVGGLEGVTRGRPVGVVLASPLSDPLDQALLVADVVQENGLRLEAISAGDARVVGDVSWRVIWPRRIIRAGSVPNNASVVLVAEVRGHTVLLTGDIEPEAQTALLADVAGLRPDVVKVPHHGSRYQSTAFAERVRAPIALVSVGADNDYGHPAPETVELYGEGGGVVVRTDEMGAVAVVEGTDGGVGGAIVEGTDAPLGIVTRGGMLPSS